MSRKLANPLITEDDAFLAAALEHASVSTLLMTIVHLTGDASLLRGPIRPQRPLPGEADGGLSDADKAAVRAMGLEALRAYRDRGGTLPSPPSAATSIRRSKPSCPCASCRTAAGPHHRGSSIPSAFASRRRYAFQSLPVVRHTIDFIATFGIQRRGVHGLLN